ncbi:hypothetical protein LQZ18_06215 [Lachnospiraceae bacterium ZAX-1]
MAIIDILKMLRRGYDIIYNRSRLEFVNAQGDMYMSIGLQIGRTKQLEKQELPFGGRMK